MTVDRIILDAVICAGARAMPGQITSAAYRGRPAGGSTRKSSALEPLPFSSTQVRARACRQAMQVVPPERWRIIMENRLYQSSQGAV